MRKKQTSAFAQRAFEWLARSIPPGMETGAVIRIHAGTGQCRCTACEDALKTLDRIGRAGQK